MRRFKIQIPESENRSQEEDQNLDDHPEAKNSEKEIIFAGISWKGRHCVRIL
jgi:hypothetical protein